MVPTPETTENTENVQLEMRLGVSFYSAIGVFFLERGCGSLHRPPCHLLNVTIPPSPSARGWLHSDDFQARAIHTVSCTEWLSLSCFPGQRETIQAWTATIMLDYSLRRKSPLWCLPFTSGHKNLKEICLNEHSFEMPSALEQ